MNLRDEQLLSLRPEINAEVTEPITDEEKFQHQTLRPILKWQNSILISVFRHHINTRKDIYYDLPSEQRHQYIAQVLRRAKSLMGSVKGVVIGHFIEAEFAQYSSQAHELDKRMLSMIAQRLQNQLTELDLLDFE